MSRLCMAILDGRDLCGDDSCRRAGHPRAGRTCRAGDSQRSLQGAAIGRRRPRAIRARRVTSPPPTRSSCRTAPSRRLMRMETSSSVPRTRRRPR